MTLLMKNEDPLDHGETIDWTMCPSNSNVFSLGTPNHEGFWDDAKISKPLIIRDCVGHSTDPTNREICLFIIAAKAIDGATYHATRYFCKMTDNLSWLSRQHARACLSSIELRLNNRGIFIRKHSFINKIPSLVKEIYWIFQPRQFKAPNSASMHIYILSIGPHAQSTYVECTVCYE